MKVLISVDIEGVSGIVHEDEIAEGHREYEKYGQGWVTGDTNAAVEGALAAGADYVVVNDSHGKAKRNIIYDQLHPEAYLIRGGPTQPLHFLEGLEPGFSAVALVGWHGKIGSAGVLSHAYSATQYRDIRVNGRSIGEIGFAVGVAGAMGVPVVFISGDDVACRELQDFEPNAATAVVKKAIDRNVALCLPQRKARDLITTGIRAALENVKAFRPYVWEPPYTLEVETQATIVARQFLKIPGVEYDNRLTVRYTCNDFLELYRTFLNMRYLSYSVPI